MSQLHTSVLTFAVLSAEVHAYAKYGKVHFEYSDGALMTVKKWSVERWTLLTPKDRHLALYK